LRRAIAQKLAADNQLFLDPQQEILICNGVSQGIALMLDAFVDGGERVVILDPSFFIYRLVAQNRGAVVVRLPTWVDQGCTRFEERSLRRRLRGARALYLNSPANPTGGVLDRETLERIAWWCDRFDVLIFSDEVYERFQYEGRHFSIASLPKARNRTVTANGFSKSHGMAGYRVAYLAAPRHLIQPLLVSQLASAPFVSFVGQQMALAALRQPAEAFEPILNEYRRRRELVAERLGPSRLPIPLPAGAFYFWIPVWRLGWTGEAFAAALLQTSGVRVMSGASCGPSGKGCVRLSYSGKWQDLVEGLDRLEGFLADAPTAAPATGRRWLRKSA
jgi:aminotransferase